MILGCGRYDAYCAVNFDWISKKIRLVCKLKTRSVNSDLPENMSQFFALNYIRTLLFPFLGADCIMRGTIVLIFLLLMLFLSVHQVLLESWDASLILVIDASKCLSFRFTCIKLKLDRLISQGCLQLSAKCSCTSTNFRLAFAPDIIFDIPLLFRDIFYTEKALPQASKAKSSIKFLFGDITADVRGDYVSTPLYFLYLNIASAVRDGNRTDLYNRMIKIITAVSWYIKIENLYIYTPSSSFSINYVKLKFRRQNHVFNCCDEKFHFRADYICIRQKTPHSSPMNSTSICRDKTIPLSTEFHYVYILLLLPRVMIQPAIGDHFIHH
jgi:hypothetical protein